MMAAIEPLVAWLGLAMLGVSTCYALVTCLAVLIWRLQRSPAPHSAHRSGVSVLKPLCGAEPGLYQNLRSFCLQDYHDFQIVFGVASPADPALLVVRRLQAEFPLLSIDVVINPQQHGSNRKVSSLINMTPYARHSVLAMSDSDARVTPDYLAAITAPLTNPDVGLVTCVYRDLPVSNTWSRLGAMYVNEWYMPSVLLAHLFGHREYVSGLTTCLRRDTLRAIGGLSMIANHIADDYQLGALVRGLGQRVFLSPYLIRAEHYQPDIDSLIRHEVRWLRTIRILKPHSYCMLFVTFSSLLATLGFMLTFAHAGHSIPARLLLIAALSARLLLHFINRQDGDLPRLADLCLLPVRDILIGFAWWKTFRTQQVSWRGREFTVDPDGIMHEQS